jgi:hypothetical protein
MTDAMAMVPPFLFFLATHWKMPHCDRFVKGRACVSSILDRPASKSLSLYVRLVALNHIKRRLVCETGLSLDHCGQSQHAVSEFQLTENALAQPEAFIAALTQSIEDIEEEP